MRIGSSPICGSLIVSKVWSAYFRPRGADGLRCRLHILERLLSLKVCYKLLFAPPLKASLAELYARKIHILNAHHAGTVNSTDPVDSKPFVAMSAGSARFAVYVPATMVAVSTLLPSSEVTAEMV